MGLHGLRTDFRLMCPARHCAGLWSLVLTDNVMQHEFEGGRYFVYAPATVSPAPSSTRTSPCGRSITLVRFVWPTPVSCTPRVSRAATGHPGHPDQARVVASATPLTQ